MAKFNCAALLRKRQFQRVTGVEPSLFLDMVERVRARWQQRVVDPKNRAGRPWGIGGLEDHLLVLLIPVSVRDYRRIFWGFYTAWTKRRSATPCTGSSRLWRRFWASNARSA